MHRAPKPRSVTLAQNYPASTPSGHPRAKIQELQITLPIADRTHEEEEEEEVEERERSLHSLSSSIPGRGVRGETHESTVLQQLQALHFVGGQQLVARYGADTVIQVLDDVAPYVAGPESERRFGPDVRSPGIIRWLVEHTAQASAAGSDFAPALDGAKSEPAAGVNKYVSGQYGQFVRR